MSRPAKPSAASAGGESVLASGTPTLDGFLCRETGRRITRLVQVNCWVPGRRGTSR